ncbi:MAG: c-type cytochrome, partial [Candidatus Acidiferrales bacterium]
MKNPFNGKVPDDAKQLYTKNCSKCHGENGEGMGNVPGLAHGPTQSASDGEVFWFITKGDLNNGMPSWASLPERDRWAIVTYVKSLASAAAPAANPVVPAASAPVEEVNLPLPKAPFTDYRLEKPGTIRKITLADLPPPFETPTVGNGPKIVPRPEGAWPLVPPGFQVQLYATGLGDPRLIRTAPNGDFFVAESRTGDVRVFRGITADGKPEKSEIFATELKRPFGINFYPPGP